MAGKGKPGPLPGRRFGGRQKGTPNKITGDIRAMILGALQAKGGQKYLERCADENPAAFLTLVGKVLPMQVQGDPERPLQHSIEVVYVEPGRTAGHSSVVIDGDTEARRNVLKLPPR
jgi:hypothetical protein